MNKTVKITELAELVGGTIEGDASREATGVNSLKLASETEVSFLSNTKYKAQLEATKAAIVLVPADLKLSPKENQSFIRCANPDKSFTKVCGVFAPEPQKFEPGIHPSAVVHPTAQLAEGVYVGPTAVIEQGAVIGKNTVIGAGVYVGEFTTIGENCMIYPNVSILRRCILGNKLIIHSGATIGADGFGFTPTFTGLVKVPQNGIVQIDDNVEIGANTTVDRARFGKTWIKKGVKIDNLVQVAHNVIIGESSALISQCGVAGSAELGRGVILYAQSGVNGHITLGDGSKVAACSAAERSLVPGGAAYGTPGESQADFVERYTLPHRFRKLTERIEKLEAMLAELQQKKAE
ncbi:MAG: UDP-3-O-(3-hydroxymyristoyl)glucosamine N-acyltransferase [Lentisphaeria bacterium]|nr:UDP-3-O-(3-hydroxymyristoyl)glucosamine N-acyltransferase [Lentisphaeria bacterium]